MLAPGPLQETWQTFLCCVAPKTRNILVGGRRQSATPSARCGGFVGHEIRYLLLFGFPKAVGRNDCTIGALGHRLHRGGIRSQLRHASHCKWRGGAETSIFWQVASLARQDLAILEDYLQEAVQAVAVKSQRNIKRCLGPSCPCRSPAVLAVAAPLQLGRAGQVSRALKAAAGVGGENRSPLPCGLKR